MRADPDESWTLIALNRFHRVAPMWGKGGRGVGPGVQATPRCCSAFGWSTVATDGSKATTFVAVALVLITPP